jgi:thioredoxin reductase (NADPH)
MLDVLIIGGGPIGLACGLEAQQRGLRSLIVEKGCLVNSLFRYPTNMTFFSTSELLEIGGVPFISQHPKPKRAEALEYYRRVQQQAQLPIALYERVLGAEALPDGTFRVRTDKQERLARKVVVATGFYDVPALLGVPGEDLPKVEHYYNDPHLYAGRRVLVVGAANSAVDAALETYRKGAQVTMAIRGGEISPRVKYWVRPDIDNRIKEGSIAAHFHTQVHRIEPDSAWLRTPQGLLEVPNDHVLALTGYEPDFGLLEKLGIALDGPDRMPRYDPETQESPIPGLYLAGVVCGGRRTSQWFIENSRVHAARIMAHIAAT